MRRERAHERPNWRTLADEYGFEFHTINGEKYWDESAYYRFSLRQIEEDIETPSAELHQMCLEIASDVVESEELMTRFRIPREYWDLVRESKRREDPALYSRLDLAYDGRGEAKLYENNADTPTSVFETGFWQWLWLEDLIKSGQLKPDVDQFNSLQEKLVARFRELGSDTRLHFSCCRDSAEDRGTVQYLEDCAQEAGLETAFVYIEDIGKTADGAFADLEDEEIAWNFKLYPWEFMFQEEFGKLLPMSWTTWLEPPWKALLSNKALLPMLWKKFPRHPNLLPAYFEDEVRTAPETRLVKKPIFSREGANITFLDNKNVLKSSPGPYGDEGFIYQAFHQLPRFGDAHTLVGSWLIDDEPAGLSIREDASPITQNTSRFLPHIIV